MIIYRGRLKYLEKNLALCHSVHQKFHVDCPMIEPGPQRLEASDWPSELRHGDGVPVGSTHTVALAFHFPFSRSSK
jgi:hypothetical protein